jgi:Tfp pilus assembly protein PilX
MTGRQGGTALVVTLVLLSGLGALALAAAAAAVTALALASHQQTAQDAFEAAEAGIAHALAQAARLRRATSIPQTRYPDEATGVVTFETETLEMTAPGALPAGFSIGENAETFAAKHFFIRATGHAGRNARARLEQGFYFVVPAP